MLWAALGQASMKKATRSPGCSIASAFGDATDDTSALGLYLSKAALHSRWKLRFFFGGGGIHEIALSLVRLQRGHISKVLNEFMKSFTEM